MADPQLRIRLPAGGDASEALTVVAGPAGGGPRGFSESYLPAKEWCIVDDVLTVADSASFTIANADGANTDKITPGQRVEIETKDDAVAGGQWTRIFTGRAVRVEHGSDVSGGSTIRVDCMDLGWHLTSCCARPLMGTAGGTLAQLISRLIHPTWGFASTHATVGNVLNRALKQGRTGAARQFVAPATILPYIQVEPGQTPWQVLQTYCVRAGVLVNVGAKGDLIIFQPDYQQQSPYATLEYHGSSDAARTRNNVVGRPSKSEAVDGLYSEVQCWSTTVAPQIAAEVGNNPNAAYRHSSFTPSTNPLPFNRLKVDTDGEAINETMRHNRAQWRWQMDAFNSWEYHVEVRGHSSRNPSPPWFGATLWASDSLVSVNDTVHRVRGTYYVQRVQRSFNEREGARTKLLLRKPGLLNPALQAQTGGTAHATGGSRNTTVAQSNGSTVTIPKVVP